MSLKSESLNQKALGISGWGILSPAQIMREKIPLHYLHLPKNFYEHIMMEEKGEREVGIEK